MLAYRSRQFLYQNPIALSVLLGAAALSVLLLLVVRDGDEPNAVTGVWWLAGSIAVAVLLPLATPMTISVDDTSVRMSFAGILKRTVALEDVVAAEIRGYQPVRDFGGWGWRKGLGQPNAMSYTTRGNTAVVLTLFDRSEIYLGVDDEQGMLAALAPRIGVNR